MSVTSVVDGLERESARWDLTVGFGKAIVGICLYDETGLQTANAGLYGRLFWQSARVDSDDKP